MNRILIRVFHIFLPILLLSDIVYASQPGYSLGEALLKLIIYMFIVILVLGLTIFGTRFLARNSQKFIRSRYMKIVDILNIGTNTKILMIEIGDYVYVIVLTNNSIELIEKIRRDEIIKDEDFEDKLNRHTLSHKNFTSIRKMLDRSYKFKGEEDKDER